MKPFKKITPSIMIFVFLVCCSSAEKQEQVHFKETIVAGSSDHLMEVHHVIMKGANYEIGKKIAEIAQKGGVQLLPSDDHLRNKVQREYMNKNYPLFYERMKGIAAAYGLDIQNDAYDFSRLPQFPASPPGCSVVFYPGELTENGHNILSRNYDFTTGTIQGKRPQKGEVRVMSRPYVLEIYPDKGYPSLSICAFDLLGGVLDGINSEGLCVAILADEESWMKFGLNPANGIGLHELLSMRYLLDNCKDTREAKEAMLYQKHFYSLFSHRKT